MIVLANVSIAAVLAENDELQIAIEILQLLFIRARHAARRNLGDFGDHLFDVFGTDRFAPFLFGLDLHRGADLVDHVDRLVRQAPVVDMLGRKFDRRADRAAAVMYAVMLFVVRL